MQVNPIQLFDAESSTYTYILSTADSLDAVIIDPVDRHWQRDLAHVERLGLKLTHVLETHAHADHVTSAGKLRALTGAKACVPSGCGIPPAEIQLRDSDLIRFGQREHIAVIHTPGHTAGSMCYLWRGNLFTGDTLLINGCGRTDFQNGDAAELYRSVTEKLFALPDDCLVYPAHDYQGRRVSSIAQEKQRNPRLGGGRSLDEFLRIMADLKLPYPKFIDHAVPGNRLCGTCPTDLPDEMRAYCERMTESPQG